MLSREMILEQLISYMNEMFEIPREKITLDTSLFEDLDLDSIDGVDLIVKLQELTGRRIAPEEFKAVRTVGDIVTCVEKYLANDAPAQS